MRTLLASLPVRGPNGQRVQVLFYEGGSIRFRIYNAGPMAITEAFLLGVDK